MLDFRRAISSHRALEQSTQAQKHWSRRKILADHFRRHLMVGGGKDAQSSPHRQVTPILWLFAADHLADDRHGRECHAQTHAQTRFEVAQL